MKERKKKYVALWQVMQRECRRLVSRPLYLFCMVIAPLFCYLFFTTLMDSGLPQNLPAGVVDMDDSSTSRNIVRNLDAFSQTGVVAHYSNVTDARIAVQEGKDLRFLLYPERLVGRGTKPTAAQNLFLHQLLLSDCRFFTIQRHENDGRTHCRLCGKERTVRQRGYGRSGNGLPATDRD